MVTFFTVLLSLFVVVMLLFLWLVRKEIIYQTVRNRWIYLVILFLVSLVIWYTLASHSTAGESAEGILSAMISVSSLLDSRGITEEGPVSNSFDKKGVPFSEINKIVLYQPEGSRIVKVNFFRSGQRGPILKFSASLEKLVPFLSQRLNDKAEIDIMTDPE